MKRRLMKCLVLVLALVLIGAPVAIAAEGYVQDIGSWSDPITGEVFKFVNAKSNDSIRQNQSIIYVMHTEVKLDPKTNRYAPKTDMLRADAAASNGIWNGFMQGGFAGLAQGAGVLGGMALLRPSPTNVNQEGGGVGSNTGNGSGGINLNNTQSQTQRQRSNNTNTNINRNRNNNNAQGGAGGAGGNVGNVSGGNVVNSGNNVGVATANNSINAGSGGIGNISAQGNSVVNTGQGMINTGNNATITGPLSQF